jgi:hypothetical protein
MKNIAHAWRPFPEACAFVQSLELKSENQWRAYCKSGKEGIHDGHRIPLPEPRTSPPQLPPQPTKLFPSDQLTTPLPQIPPHHHQISHEVCQLDAVCLFIATQMQQCGPCY